MFIAIKILRFSLTISSNSEFIHHHHGEEERSSQRGDHPVLIWRREEKWDRRNNNNTGRRRRRRRRRFVTPKTNDPCLNCVIRCCDAYDTLTSYMVLHTRTQCWTAHVYMLTINLPVNRLIVQLIWRDVLWMFRLREKHLRRYVYVLRLID